MADDTLSKFPKPTVDLVAKRAGYVCSNPACLAQTSGPSTQSDKAIIVGEAAHIYGGKLGAARFLPEMSVTQRKDIANAIWLCRNCHKAVDSDVSGHPAELLFGWRRAHEKELALKLGKAAAIGNDVVEERASLLSGVSSLAQQITIERSRGWEYLLTIEILRVRFSPIVKRWVQLKKLLYTKPSDIVPIDRVDIWRRARQNELTRLIGPVTGIVENEFAEAWGAPGEPGSEAEILQACELFCDLSSQLLIWEESVRFATLPHEFEDFQAALAGPAGLILEKLVEVPNSIKALLDSGQTSGRYDVVIKFVLPDGWVDGLISSYRQGWASTHGLDVDAVDWDD